MQFIRKPGGKIAFGLMKNLPKIFFGMTPESLKSPQYSLVSNDGSVASAPNNKQPFLCLILLCDFLGGSYSSGE